MILFERTFFFLTNVVFFFQISLFFFKFFFTKSPMIPFGKDSYSNFLMGGTIFCDLRKTREKSINVSTEHKIYSSSKFCMIGTSVNTCSRIDKAPIELLCKHSGQVLASELHLGPAVWFL